MIVRMWRGETPLSKADEYLRLMHEVAIPDYAATPGNLGAYALRRDGEATAEFLMLTFWESLDVIRGFAGEDIEAARYYDFDDDFLIEKRRTVEHFATSGPPPAPAT